MYAKNLKYKMTLRLDDTLKEYLNEMSDKFQMSPSDYIRQCIYRDLDARKMTEKLLNNISNNVTTTIKEGFENGTDHKTNNDNLV